MVVETFTRFYRRYYRLMLTVAEQRVGGFSDAEDIVAEAFRISWVRYHDGEELTLPWLYQVLRNVIGNEYRRVNRADQFAAATAPLTLGHILGPETADAAEVREVIRSLPLEDRELLYMAYWEDLSGDEIAAILGVRPGTVRVRLLRARRKVGSLLDSNSAAQRTEANHGRD
ncbi:RNA polymerase sigma factor [Microbacterium album]|uniref:RNA polymerase n=1 Tax=Microbacterium album TaxID=2053191 RepID=A0A917MJZ4_9MICO|nr:sigma-70 family RNA polymerase sigma factor [Microbacterium album]GGH33754.1 hypothetical protein GCM10010921_00960 [Microbacterium album]